jgi:hypothetical protein
MSPVVNPESSGSDALGVLPEVLVPFLETVGEEDFLLRHPGGEIAHERLRSG